MTRVVTKDQLEYSTLFDVKKDITLLRYEHVEIIIEDCQYEFYKAVLQENDEYIIEQATFIYQQIIIQQIISDEEPM